MTTEHRTSTLFFSGQGLLPDWRDPSQAEVVYTNELGTILEFWSPSGPTRYMQPKPDTFVLCLSPGSPAFTAKYVLSDKPLTAEEGWALTTQENSK